MKHSITIFTLAAAVLLVGCGGGGGGSSSGGSGGGGGSGGVPQTAEGQLRATARNSPIFGSVSQGPTTTETTAVAYPTSNSGAVTVTATIGGQEHETTYPGTASGNVNLGGSIGGGQFRPTGVHESYSSTYSDGATVFESVQNPAGGRLRYVQSFNGGAYRIENPEGAENPDYYDNGLWALFFTNRDGAGVDYLTFGQWLYFPQEAGRNLANIERAEGADPLSIEDFFAAGGRYGMFVDGLETTDALPTSGSATYTGITQGYGDDADGLGYLFGRVVLEATFGADAHVSGTIDRFARLMEIDEFNRDNTGVDESGDGNLLTVPNENLFSQDTGSDPSWGTVTLGEATVTTRPINGISTYVFEGAAAGGTETGDARGQWGGQFFGNDGAGVAPPAIGGTWGVASGTHRLVGSFGAWKP